MKFSYTKLEMFEARLIKYGENLSQFKLIDISGRNMLVSNVLNPH